MKIIATIKQNLLKSALFILVSASGVMANAQSSNGIQSPSAGAEVAAQPVVTTNTTNSDKPAYNTPVNKLASFTAMLNNNSKVDLKWSTETETNLSHIMVEKSVDGKNFKEAALVFTYGNTTTKSDYAFADNISKVKAGTVYYRLRTVTEDGTTQYSDICIVKISK